MTDANSSRIQWFDSIKGFAILAVVLGHVLNGYMENNAFPAVNEYLILSKNWIYLWHMPLFIFLSGFAFSLNVLGVSDEGCVLVKQDKVKRSVINWLIVYVVFELGLSVSNIIFSNYVDNETTVGELFDTLFFPKNIMWYLWTIILFYIIFSWLIVSRIRKPILLIIFIVISIAVAFFNDIYGLRRCFQGLFGYAIFFYLGILYREYTKISNNLGEKARGGIVFLSFLYVICFSIFFVNDCTPSNVLISEVLEFTMALAMIIVVLTVFLHKCFLGESKLFSSLGKASLVIYVLHSYFVSAIKYVVIKNGQFNPLFAILVTFVVPILISYGIYLLSKKNRWIGYLFKPIRLIDCSRGEKR